MSPAPVCSLNERETFTVWMADHRGIVVKIVRGFTSDPTDADDLTQEITLALWRSIPSFRGESKASTWIWRIALNQAISWQRGAGPTHAAIDQVAESAAADRADDRILIDRIYEAIKTLGPLDRALVMLSLDGYRYAEMAEITGLTETNVGARLSRARTRLNEGLEDAR